MLQVNVRFYAMLREHHSIPEQQVNMPDGSSVQDVVAACAPEGLRSGLRCAVNERFVTMEHVLESGDVVDLLPPFGGG